MSLDIDLDLERAQLRWGLMAASHGLVIVAANADEIIVRAPDLEGAYALSLTALSHMFVPSSAFLHAAHELSRA